MSSGLRSLVPPPSLLDRTESRRQEAANRLDAQTQANLGQYFTPTAIAEFMASLFDLPPRDSSILDPGAGIGNLSAAVAERWARTNKEHVLRIRAIDIDTALVKQLRITLAEFAAESNGLMFEADELDFVEWASDEIAGAGLYSTPPEFDMVVMNPPYAKLRSDSRERKLLRGGFTCPSLRSSLRRHG